MIRLSTNILRKRLETLFSEGDAAGMLQCMNELSNDSFRQASAILRDSLLSQAETSEKFWLFFLTIVPTDNKAFLGTFLKPAVALYQKNILKFDDLRLENFCNTCTTIDRRKILDAFLPIIKSDAEGKLLLQTFAKNDLNARLSSLLKVSTPVAAYLLFQETKYMQGDDETIEKVVQILIRRADRIGINLAAIMKHYFDLKNVKANFSLRLEAWQLARLDSSYDNFNKILLSI